MRIFKDKLKLEKMRNLDKRLVWAIATMAFRETYAFTRSVPHRPQSSQLQTLSAGGT